MRSGPDVDDAVQSADRISSSRSARIRRSIRRHPLRYGFVTSLVIAGVVFVLFYFAPQDLFLDTSVSQPLPVATVVPSATDATSQSAAPRVTGPSGSELRAAAKR